MSHRLGCVALLIVTAIAPAAAHVIRGLENPAMVTAFISSPSGTPDAPVPLVWGDHDTGLRVACFFAANSSPKRADAPAWPRITAVGFELPGKARGYSLLSPLDEGWELVEQVAVAAPNGATMTVDFALVAPVHRAWRGIGLGRRTPGIEPGQTAARRNGTRFCVSGPFPNDPASPPDAPAALTIEQIINGAVVRFHGVYGRGPSVELGVWENTAQRPIPLYP